MQLFIIPKPDSYQSITLDQVSMVHQMRRVLRMQSGDRCSLQWSDGDIVHRGVYQIDTISKQSILLTIDGDMKSQAVVKSHVVLAIALPNKRSKAELIVQKLAEIGVDRVVWFVAQRSQYRSLPDKKLMRMRDIATEATEQSRGWKEMKVDFNSNLGEVIKIGEEVWIADIVSQESRNKNQERSDKKLNSREETIENNSAKKGNDSVYKKNTMILIGPEGGRGPQDYEVFGTVHYRLLNLGDRILRMETAAIVAGRSMTQRTSKKGL